MTNGFQRGKIDTTLFRKNYDSHFIIKEFEISVMGELKFFLGLQIKQAEDEIYICQTKYVKELLKNLILKIVKQCQL
ncbi:hypothetical protein CR513_48775, partial [Mucuna pruriens]